MVEQSVEARDAVVQFIARRLSHHTPYGIALHAERLIRRKTCAACWCTIGLVIQARYLRPSLAHVIGCEEGAARMPSERVHLRSDPTLALLLRAARRAAARHAADAAAELRPTDR